MLGIIPIIKKLHENDDAYHEYRLKLYRETNQQTICVRFGRINGIFVADVQLAKFFLALPPHIIEKSGMLSTVFNADPNGFVGGLLLDEGQEWQVHRKEISKIFHSEIMEHYIEAMDVSALTFTENLCKTEQYLV